MAGRGCRQGHGVPDGFVEAGIGSVAEQHRLVGVVHEVLDVTHFVVNCDQVFHVDGNAQFHAEGRRWW